MYLGNLSTVRTNPDHWIWQETFTESFTPQEDCYVALRLMMTTKLIHQTEQLIAEGMRAEQIVALWQIVETLPEDVAEMFGCGLAFWIKQMHNG